MRDVDKRIFALITALALVVFTPPARAGKIPDMINLNSLENLYEHVQFNHAGHISLIKDCGECHHHTTGTLVGDANCVRCHRNSGATQVVSCRGCHRVNPFSAEALKAKGRNSYHRDVPGLKGAYHLGCVGCHKKMAGPVGCGDCHPRNKFGDEFFSAGRHAKTAENCEGKH